MEHLGFIGMGSMAGALAQGFISSGALRKDQVFAYAPHQEKLKVNAERIGFVPVATLGELAEKADTLLLACKPYQIEGVVAELRDQLCGKALISVAAGWDFERYQKVLPEGVRSSSRTGTASSLKSAPRSWSSSPRSASSRRFRLPSWA